MSETTHISDRLRLNSTLLEMALSVSTNVEANKLADFRIDLCQEAAGVIDDLLEALTAAMVAYDPAGIDDAFALARAAISKAQGSSQ